MYISPLLAEIPSVNGAKYMHGYCRVFREDRFLATFLTDTKPLDVD